jgi:hypothetical protein
MSKAPVPYDISASPEFLRLVEEIEETGVSRVLVRDDEEIAVITPIRTRKPRLQPERVLNIIGLGESPEGSDVARFKDEYLADAAAHRGE